MWDNQDLHLKKKKKNFRNVAAPGEGISKVKMWGNCQLWSKQMVWKSAQSAKRHDVNVCSTQKESF